MPEMHLTARWPDGSVHDHYSPSLVLHDYLQEGQVYPVADFVTRTNTALTLASERVQAKFGFACTSAAASNQEIAKLAASCDPSAEVLVLEMAPPLPPEAEGAS